MSDNSFKIEAGRTVSHFRLEKLLGEGGMGDVFLAEDLTLSRQVAIKFMRRSMLASLPNPDARRNIEQRFIREAKSAAAINHPNIAQIYEANFESDNWYIAMEFINGSALDEILKDSGPFSANRIIPVMKQTIIGLKFAWDNYKIIHRDIKPQNLMLTKDEYVKIVDLGLAKPIIESSEDELELTGAGVPVGTPYYMAPEQAIGGEIDFQADIFALGTTVYELLSGKKCFKGKTPPMIYNKMINKDYEPLTEFGVDPQLSALIDKMIEPKKIDRISSYDELLKEISLSTVAHDDNAETLLDVRGLGHQTVNDLSQAGTVFGTAVTGSLSEEMATMIDVFLPIDFKINDRYRILKVIGRGNSGIVYKCLDTQLERECTIKSIASGREYTVDVFPRIKKNFKRLAGLKHKNLVEIMDIQESEDGNEIFVVMELLSGKNLLQYFNSLSHVQEKVDLEKEAEVLKSIAKGLDSVGQQFSLVHNDLKPVSIFVCDDGSIKFLDYGVTYLHHSKDVNIKDKEIWKYPIADPDYMSPEIWKHEKPSIAADQYSFAVIVYELLSHKLPFWLKELKSQTSIDAGNFAELLKLQYERVISQIPESIEGLSRSENKSLLRALSKTPDQRFSSCEEFVKTLIGEKKSKAPVLAIAAAALVVAGVFVFQNRSKSSEENAPPVSTKKELSLEEIAQKKVEEAARQKIYEEKQKLLKGLTDQLVGLQKLWQGLENQVKDDGKIQQFNRLSKAAISLLEKENIDQLKLTLSELSGFIKSETARIDSELSSQLNQLLSLKAGLQSDVSKLSFLDSKSEEKLQTILVEGRTVDDAVTFQRIVILKKQIEELKQLKVFLETTARNSYLVELKKAEADCSELIRKLSALKDFSNSYEQLTTDLDSAKDALKNSDLKISFEKLQALQISTNKELKSSNSALRDKVNSKHKELTEQISKLESDKEINPEIALEVDELSVQFRLARALKSERKYLDAYDEYNSLAKVILTLQKKVSSLKTAKEGSDWKILSWGCLLSGSSR